jgi:hypothetical protein
MRACGTSTRRRQLVELSDDVRDLGGVTRNRTATRPLTGSARRLG